MTKAFCMSCQNEIEVPEEYELQYCCDGRECGCMGLPINIEPCKDCMEEMSKKPGTELYKIGDLLFGADWGTKGDDSVIVTNRVNEDGTITVKEVRKLEM